MPFPDALELFEYWAIYPPLHVMVRNYLGYEDKRPEPVDVAQMLRSTTGRSRAPKLSTAPERDRKIFEEMAKRAGRHP